MALLGMERTGRAPSTLLLLGAPRPAQNEHHQLELNPGTLDECSIRIPIFEGAEIEKGVAKWSGTNTNIIDRYSVMSLRLDTMRL